jgi:hypothetical protein
MISYDLNGSKEESKWVTNPKDTTEENDGHGYELSLSIYYQFFLKKKNHFRAEKSTSMSETETPGLYK